MNQDGHRALRESLGAYLLGQLPEAERLAVRAHLDGCPQCRAELAEIEPVAGPLRAVDPDALDGAPAPPPWLGEQIVRRALADTPPRRRRRGWVPAVAAAAVAAVVAGAAGFLAGREAGPAVPREPVALQAYDARLDATASVIPHTWGVEITLDADGFAAGAVYRVVVTDDTGRSVGAGEFIGTGGNRLRCNLNSSVLRADATGFDVLDRGGTVVLHGDL